MSNLCRRRLTLPVVAILCIINALEAATPEKECKIRAEIRSRVCDWADKLVRIRIRRFLKQYNLPAITPDEKTHYRPLIHEKLDQMLQKDLENDLPPQQQLSLEEKSAVEQLQAIACEELRRDAKQVTIIHKPDQSWLVVYVKRHYATNSYYVYVNATLHAQFLPLFRELMLCESCRYYDDELITRLLVMRAWDGTDAGMDELRKQLQPVRLAMEVRADINMVTMSPTQGKHLTELLIELLGDFTTDKSLREGVDPEQWKAGMQGLYEQAYALAHFREALKKADPKLLGEIDCYETPAPSAAAK